MQIKTIFDQTLKAGIFEFSMDSKRLASAWRHRAYRFRKKLKEPIYESIFISLEEQGKQCKVTLRAAKPIVEDEALKAEAQKLKKWIENNE